MPFATGSSTTGTSAEDESTASSDFGASPAPVSSSSLVVDGTTGVISDSSISFVTAGSAATGASLKDFYFMWIKKEKKKREKNVNKLRDHCSLLECVCKEKEKWGKK